MSTLFEDLQQSLQPEYTLKHELGGGGMSRVFVAHEEKLDRDVVVKVLSSELSATLSVERFTREIRLAAGLQQANIVPVLSAGAMKDGIPYYIMPLVDGQSLRDRLNGDTVISLRAALKILTDITCALEYAHARGIVHRDIKPENILLSGGTAVVTDFGIAKAITASKTQAPGGTLTVVGTSLGTPAYMAPEQAVGDTVDQRADIYAWGVIAYELLSGKHPFGSKTTAQQLIAAHIAEAPKDLADSASNIPPAISALVMRALAKNPEDRPQTAQEIQRLLDDPSISYVATTQSGPIATAARPAATSTATRSKKSIPAIVAAILGIVVIGLVALKAGKKDGTTTVVAGADSSIHTVAVLPFVNTGGDPKDEYFSDGMTDELARALSKLPDVHVASRTSAYSFKGKNTDAKEIGKALNVAGIVEGTVRRAGDRLRVSAQLTNANTGLVIWSDGFERASTNVFQVQDELTAAIVGALSTKLQSEHRTLASDNRGTNDREAYDLYLRGRFSWNKRTADALQDAAIDLERAIARDPKFARAHAALASTYAISSQYSRKVPREESHRKGTAAALRALEFDPTLAEPHAVLGFIHFNDWKWSEAESEFRKAIEADSSYATSYQWYAFLLVTTDRVKESMEMVKHAHKLDPLSRVISDNICGRAMLVNDRALGEKACADALPILDGPAMFAMLQEKWDEAADKWNRYGQSYSAQGFSAYCLVRGGRTAEAREKLKKFLAAGNEPMNVALTYLGLGQKDSTLMWLDRAVTAHESALTTTAPLLAGTAFDPLRGDPRFEKLIDKMGLRPYAKSARQ